MEFGKSKKTTEIKPLQGIKIVELSTVVTAALATKLLTEQGAENVKAEPVGIGDARRLSLPKTISVNSFLLYLTDRKPAKRA